MKKMLLVIAVSFFTLEAIAQVVVAGVSPASVQGNYDYGIQANEGGWPGETDDGTWALALDFNIDGTYVQGEIMLVEDGQPGTNLQGNPISQEGCNSLTNDLTGKIAVIYRNTCNFSLKALNAQNAGAIAVIIVNREDVGLSMTAGPDGINVTIPVVILNKTDGTAMIAAMQGGTVPVVMFIGNKFGIFANDIGSGIDNTIIATQATTPSILAQSAADFSFTPGIAIVNYGTYTQTDAYVTATIDAPGAPAAYTSTVGPLTIAYKDTINIFDGNAETFALFSLPTYPLGEYTLNYTLSFINAIANYDLTLINQGTGYTTGNDIATTGGTGTGLTLDILASPIIDSVTLLTNLTPGTNYLDSIGALTTTNGSGLGLTLNITAETIGEALIIDTLTTGSNYIDSLGAPTLAIIGTGTGLTVGYTTTSGFIDSLFIVNGGSGYEVNDTIKILAGDSSATFVINSVTVGEILTFSINNPGSGYSVGDSVHIEGGLNGNLIVTSVGTSGGTIISIDVNNLVSGYNLGDMITIAGGNGATFTISGIDTTTIDDALGDNSFTSNFYVSDDIYSYARLNMVDNEPVSMSYPMNYTEGYKSCIRFNNANASRAGVEGLYTSIKVDLDTFDLQAQDIALYAYTWNDVATTFSATPTFLDLTDVAFAQYNPTASYVNGDEIFIPFTVPFILVDNTNYLFCVETQIPEPAFGYDDVVNYNANSSVLDDVITPIYINNIGTTTDQWFAAGWNGSPAPSIGLKLFPAAELGLVDATELKGIAYPNPASDNVTVSINATGAATLVVTDITGKIVLNKNLSLTNGSSDVNTSSLEAGIYIFNVTLDNKQTSQFNVVIK
jgi:hypothetical protein